MINIGEISKPSVATPGGEKSKVGTGKKIENISGIDATRKVESKTREQENQEADAQEKSENELKNTKRASSEKETTKNKVVIEPDATVYDEHGKKVEEAHIDLKA